MLFHHHSPVGLMFDSQSICEVRFKDIIKVNTTMILDLFVSYKCNYNYLTAFSVCGFIQILHPATYASF